jgi:KipI family sensor histidine kinase inhibitor
VPRPTLIPLGDSAIVVRFGTVLTDSANRAAVALADTLALAPIAGVVEVMPNLISVLLRYDPRVASAPTILGEVRLRMAGLSAAGGTGRRWSLAVTFDGPDLEAAAAALGMSRAAFIAAHNRAPLRVLATGFAPGFVYCGLHPDELVLPRRSAVRPAVPAGSVLFAAGQTAITATEIPTGWHVIGHTEFRNFDPQEEVPTRLSAGDMIDFEVAS